MKAIIMAGGKGTRLYPVSADMPKPMTQLMGLPLMEHIVELLRQNGFTQLCITVGYMADAIMDYFGSGDKFGVSVEYRVEKEPRGTAGGVAACADFYGNDDFLVISGDAACDFDLAGLFEKHKSSGADLTMALYSHPEPLQYGTVLVSPDGRVRSFIEKPDWPRVVTDLVNTGIYIVSPQVTELIPKDTAFDFARDVFPIMQQRDMFILGVKTDGYWCDVGSPSSYLACCIDALSGKLQLKKTAPGRREETGGNFICAGATIDKSAIIKNSIIHSSGKIGAGSEVTNSVVDGTIGENCKVSGAVICRGAEVADGQTVPAGSVVSPFSDAKKADASAKTETRAGTGSGLGRELSCVGRAGLMRELSDYLWEVGADFSDGINLTDGHCRVHISPLADESAISVQAAGGSQRERTEACSKYFELAKRIEQNKYSF